MPSLCHHTINQPALNCQFSPLQITAHFLHFSPLLILLRKATPHTHTGTWSNYTLIGQPFALRRQHTFARVPSQGLFSLGFFFRLLDSRATLARLSFAHYHTGRSPPSCCIFTAARGKNPNKLHFLFPQSKHLNFFHKHLLHFFCCLEPYALRHWEKHSAHGCCCWRFALIACRTNRRTGRRRSAHCCWSMETLDLLRASTLTNPPVILFEHSQKLRVHLYTSFLQVTLISDKFLALKGRKKTHNEQ